jgi:pSer/pThr/pTyr-binding forkhead associated (FHA) protein
VTNSVGREGPPSAADFAPMSSAGGAAFFLVSERESFALDPGEYVVGRSGDVDLSFVDDPLMSRRHARLVVTSDSLEVEDLGSSNGTWVNHELVQHRLGVPAGATLRIGSQSFVLRRAPALPRRRARMDTAPEAPSVRSVALPQELEVDGPTHPVDPLTMMYDDATRALDDGRTEDARRLVEPVLEMISATHRPLDAGSLERISVLALRLALTSGNDAYANWVVRTHLDRRAVPGERVTELLAVAAMDVVDLDFDLLGRFLSMLRRRASEPGGAQVLLICERLEEAAAQRSSTLPSPPPSRA